MGGKIKSIINKIKTNNFWKTLFTNSFYALIGDGLSSAINLIVAIILIKLIGDVGYGTLVLAQSYMWIADILLNVQSWKSVIQYGQKAIVKNADDSFCSYVKIGCILDLSTALLGGIVAIAFSFIVGNILNWNHDLTICACIFSITIFSHFSGTPTAILRLLNKFNLVAIQKILSAIIKVISLIVVWCFKGKISVINAVIIYSLTDIIGNLLLIIFAFYEFFKKYKLKKLLKAKKPNDCKEFVRYTLWGTLSEIADLPISYFDVFIVSFLDIKLVAVYKVFQQIVSILNKVTKPIYQAIMPQFSMLHAQGLKQRGYAVVLKIRNAILTIALPFSIIVGLTSPIWLKIIYGTMYMENWYILLIFLITQTLLLSYTTIHPYFLSLGNTKKLTLYVLISNIIYMVISISTIKIGGLVSLVICNFIQGVIVIGLKVHDIKKELKQN